MIDEDWEEEEEEYSVTIKGLQNAVDRAGDRYDSGDDRAALDLIIFSAYAKMCGWEILNRTIIGMDE